MSASGTGKEMIFPRTHVNMVYGDREQPVPAFCEEMEGRA